MLCGDGPMIAGGLADKMPDETTPPELVLGWLTERGRRHEPGLGLVCSDHDERL